MPFVTSTVDTVSRVLVLNRNLMKQSSVFDKPHNCSSTRTLNRVTVTGTNSKVDRQLEEAQTIWGTGGSDYVELQSHES
jgi:hypothetical protein